MCILLRTLPSPQTLTPSCLPLSEAALGSPLLSLCGRLDVLNRLGTFTFTVILTLGNSGTSTGERGGEQAAEDTCNAPHASAFPGDGTRRQCHHLSSSHLGKDTLETGLPGQPQKVGMTGMMCPKPGEHLQGTDGSSVPFTATAFLIPTEASTAWRAARTDR